MGDETVDKVAWSYEQPLEPVDDIRGLIAFYPQRVEIQAEDG